MKEWKCVLVGHHDNVGKVIEEWEKAGWRLHTYQATGNVAPASAFVNHYLLFARGEQAPRSGVVQSQKDMMQRALHSFVMSATSPTPTARQRVIVEMYVGTGLLYECQLYNTSAREQLISSQGIVDL